MTKDEFTATLRGGTQLTAAMPVTGALVKRLHERFSTGTPALWKAIEPSWSRRWFHSPREPWMLLLNALHYEALRRPDHPLARFFPTCHGSPGNLNDALDGSLDNPPADLVDVLIRCKRAFYLDLWAGLWQRAAKVFFQDRSLPFVVAELGTVGGLYAVGDLLIPSPLDSTLICGRVGLDDRPLDLLSSADRLWVMAGAAPENPQHFESISAAIKRYREIAKNGDAPAVIACDPSVSGRALSANIPPDPANGILVISYFLLDRLRPGETAQVEGDLRSLLEQWGERGLWLDFRADPEGRPGTDFQLLAYRRRAGAVRKGLVARVDLSTGAISTDGEGMPFLVP